MRNICKQKTKLCMYPKVINILNKHLRFSPKGARFIWKIQIAIEHSARTPKFFRCAAGYHWPRHLRAVFALASDGALTLYVYYRAPNQYHESFKTNSCIKFSKESIAIWIFQIKPIGENRNCLFKILITFWYINNLVFCLHMFKVQAFPSI